uniref:DNA/RNA non-specific endonuclease n=1 Tax=Laribacter hongkongensis TaxID=168471 RepID=UPI00358DB07D
MFTAQFGYGHACFCFAQKPDDLFFGETFLHVQSPCHGGLDSKVTCYSIPGGRRKLNRGDWRKMEDELRQDLKEGKSVNVKIEVGSPSGGGLRPSIFQVTPIINGKAQPPRTFHQ